MTPRSAFLSVLAAGTLLTVFPAASESAAAIPEAETSVRVQLELRASNGFEVQFETSEKKVATLTLTRGGQEVSYSTRATVTQERLRVRFGRLGLFDVTFTPTTTLNSTEPAEECTGKARTLREGTFAGTIEFRGERGYVRIEEPQAAGSMSVLPRWECPEDDSLAPFSSLSQISTLRLREATGKSKSASLYAAERGCSCLFGAGVRKDGRVAESTFFGATFEQREGLEISRVTGVEGGIGAFAFDHDSGTATLRPPSPLSGHATFERRSGPDLWRSTIKVPLPGADPLRTDGPAFEATLVRDFGFD